MPALTESTPLLAERQNGYLDLQASGQELVEREAHETTIPKPIHATTFVLSTFTLLLITGNYVIDNTVIGPVWYFTWYSEDAILTLAAYLFCSILLSAINSMMNIFLAIIIIADATFSSCIIQATVRLFESIPWQSNGLEKLPPTEPSGPRAMPLAWVIFVKVLMGTISALGMAVGALYVIILILRINGVLKIISREVFLRWKGRLLGALSIGFWESAQPHQVEEEEAENLSNPTPVMV